MMLWNAGFMVLLLLLSHFSHVRLCVTPIDGSPPGSPIPGILQARTLEWVAIFFSNAWKWKVKGKSLSHVQLFATPWTAAYQAPPSMGFSRQEYWSGVPLPSLMILYIEHHKDTIRKLLELINEFSKATGHKINIQKSLAFLYTNSKKSEREIKGTISFLIATRRINYLGINQPKTKELYTKNKTQQNYTADQRN